MSDISGILTRSPAPGARHNTIPGLTGKSPGKLTSQTESGCIDSEIYDAWEKWEGTPQGSQEAFLRVVDCITTKRDYLDLSSLYLTEIPELPPWIKYIDLHSNYNLNHSKLKLPNELKALDIRDTKLTYLEELAKLENLQILHAGSNHIEHIPENLGKELTQLYLRNNKIIYIPDLNRLPMKLKIIDLSDNPLSTSSIDKIASWKRENMENMENMEIIIHIPTYK